MNATDKKLVEVLTIAMEKPEIANALIQRVINELNGREKQETIAKWIKANTEHGEWYICPKCSHQTPRWKDEWVGLTEEEIKAVRVSCGSPLAIHLEFARAIEAKLKEKNNG